MPELVRIKEKFQVTLPVAARRRNPVAKGDYFEVLPTEDGGFLLRPQRVEAGAKPAKSMIDFLRESQQSTHVTRTRAQIEGALNADRDSWGK